MVKVIQVRDLKIRPNHGGIKSLLTDRNNHTIRKINLVGDTVNFRVDFADAAGNSGSVDNTTDNSLVKVDLEAPVILNDNITSTNQDPNWAKYGDNVTLSFSTSEPIQDPSDNITIDGLTGIVVVGMTTRPNGPRQDKLLPTQQEWRITASRSRTMQGTLRLRFRQPPSIWIRNHLP